MLHLNNHLFCAVDIETTGLIPGYHEIWNIAIVPITSDLRHDTTRPYFEQFIRPQHPERMDFSVSRLSPAAWQKLKEWPEDDEDARDKLDNWLAVLRHKFNLSLDKRIVPLSANWPALDRPMLWEFLGHEEFGNTFHPWYRDPIPFVQGIMDTHYQSDPITTSRTAFPRCNMEALCQKLHVENPRPHDALSDALALIEVYHNLCYGMTINGWEMA